MPSLPITRVVLYKHGVGYFEREGAVEGEAALALTFRQTEVSDVLKSLTVLDLDGGHIASVSYDSTKPLEQLLAEVALSIPDQGSLVSLLPQIKGARVALHSGVAEPVQGSILGIDTTERQTGDGLVRIVLLSLLTDNGDVRSFDLHALAAVQILDPGLRRDLDFYLKTQLSAKKKDARTFTFFAQGEGRRTIRVSYTLEAPVWKATYRILLGEEGRPPTIQGWAVVDNMQDEDWENVQLSLIAGLPVSFVHDLYTPRYIRRPEVRVQETTGVLPPVLEEGVAIGMAEMAVPAGAGAAPARVMSKMAKARAAQSPAAVPAARSAVSSMPAQVRERQIGDLFEYEIEHPVTIKRNQSALVPIVQRSFEGRPVLLYNKQARADNPMRCVEFKNTTDLTLEGGPVTVLEGGSYVGEAMLETTKPDDDRLVPYAVELAVHVMDNVESHNERVHRVIIRNGQLKAHYVHMQQTTYHFKNKSDAAQTVYLEHPRPGKEWKLFDTPDPHEITENYWRFRFTIDARKTTAFVVRQRQTLSQVNGLADVSDRQLALWMDEKYLDRKTAAALQQVLDARQEGARYDAALAALHQERNGIHTEQERIRENLKALGDRPGEKELRERFVRTLNSQEDRLTHIEREVQEQERGREQCRTRISELLAKLEYDAEV
jgi:hypothetical protein